MNCSLLLHAYITCPNPATALSEHQLCMDHQLEYAVWEMLLDCGDKVRPSMPEAERKKLLVKYYERGASTYSLMHTFRLSRASVECTVREHNRKRARALEAAYQLEP